MANPGALRNGPRGPGRPLRRGVVDREGAEGMHGSRIRRVDRRSRRQEGVVQMAPHHPFEVNGGERA